MKKIDKLIEKYVDKFVAWLNSSKGVEG